MKRKDHPSYWSYVAMLQRCTNPKHEHYADYGGRGITVCERWQASFDDFDADMGARPSPKHSLERRDTDGGYEPGNVRWATAKEQAFNRRNNRRVVYDGRAWLNSELAEHVGLAPGTLDNRLKKGWGVQRAISTPSAGRVAPGQFQWGGRRWLQSELAQHLRIPLGTLKQRIRLGKALDAPYTPRKTLA